MELIQASEFSGFSGELVSYRMIMVDTPSWPAIITHNQHILTNEVFIRLSEFEDLCSWCIRESVKRGVPELPVLDHFFNDRYEQAYDRIFLNQEFTLRNRIQPTLAAIKNPKCLRVLPMLGTTIIAIGT